MHPPHVRLLIASRPKPQLAIVTGEGPEFQVYHVYVLTHLPGRSFNLFGAVWTFGEFSWGVAVDFDVGPAFTV